MKKILGILVILFTIQTCAFSQADSLARRRLDTVTRKVDTLSKKIDLNRKIQDSIKTKVDTLVSKMDTPKKATVTVCHPCENHHWNVVEIILIFLPVIVFGGLIALLLNLGLGQFRIQEALAENEFPKITIVNPLYTGPNLQNLANNNQVSDILPPTLEITNVPAAGGAQGPLPSISRYIAFVSGLLTLVLAMCISCFFIYQYICTGCPPDLSPLSVVLIALGLGVTPYAVNKVSSAISSNKDSQ